MNKSEKNSQVTLENLLRLKRAERPPAEFWPQFERELRAKQLAALVTRRPWWRTLPRRAFSGLSRYHLPLGASAVLAITFLSVREYQVAGSARSLVRPVDAPATALVAEDENESVQASSGSETSTPPVRETSVAPREEAPAIAVAEHVATESQSLAGNVSAMSALVGVSASADRGAGDSPSARSIAENFAAVQSSDTPLNRALLGAQHGFESRVMPARAVDPLAQVTPPAQVRRSKYLGTAFSASMTTAATPTLSNERLVGRLSDDRLYETVSRYGFGGDRASLKF